MKERIKELAKQHFLRDIRTENGWEDYPHYEFNEDELEKFAELIVKECCQKLENDGMVEVAMEMKEHFGVNMNDQDYDEQGGERGWAER